MTALVSLLFIVMIPIYCISLQNFPYTFLLTFFLTFLVTLIILVSSQASNERMTTYTNINLVGATTPIK